MSVKLPNGVYFYSCVHIDSVHSFRGLSDGTITIRNNDSYEDIQKALLMYLQETNTRVKSISLIAFNKLSDLEESTENNKTEEK